MKLYERLANDISQQIHSGVLRPEDRIPSVRHVTSSRNVSAGTVLQAYSLLEVKGEIKARPKSGFYVSAHWKGLPPEPLVSRPPKSPQRCDVIEFVTDVLRAIQRSDAIPFGSPFPSTQFFPMEKLAQSLYAGTRRLKPQAFVEQLIPGNSDLRRLIARRYLDSGLIVRPEHIVITSGALEALNLSLQVTTSPGDIVAIESPAFYPLLEAIQRRGLKAIELPTHPRTGVDLNALETALRNHPIKACWLMTTFQNPIGSLMPEERKRQLVRMLAEHDIPLIEDDVYEELYYGDARPRPAKAFDKKGLVLHCSSFSKCLAPGYRVGWVVPGRYYRDVEWLKFTSTISTSVQTQAALAQYLRNQSYDRHLRQLRRTLAAQRDSMLSAISRHFPDGMHVTRPEGGYFLWLEMPAHVSALDVFHLAMERNITIMPGTVFSPQRKFSNCIRLNYGIPWTPRVEAAIATLGSMVESLCKKSSVKGMKEEVAA